MSAEGDFGIGYEIGQSPPSARLIGTGGFFIGRSDQLAAMTLRYWAPAIVENREFVATGGLTSYGGSSTTPTVWLPRVLKGEKPAELPANSRHGSR